VPNASKRYCGYPVNPQDRTRLTVSVRRYAPPAFQTFYPTLSVRGVGFLSTFAGNLISRRGAKTQRPKEKQSSPLFRISASQRLCASLVILPHLFLPRCGLRGKCCAARGGLRAFRTEVTEFSRRTRRKAAFSVISVSKSLWPL